MGDQRTESPLIQLGRLWVIENYPYNSTHLLKSLDGSIGSRQTRQRPCGWRR